MEFLQKLSPAEKEVRYTALKAIKDELVAATTSPLYTYRKENVYHPVIGEGNHGAKVMFVGEAPGKNEALQGRPFCGAAGKFLDTLLEHIGLQRTLVYITNLVKDRPPENRDPLPVEITYYRHFLERQMQIIKPDCVVTFGRFSMAEILEICGLKEELKPISAIHGKAFSGMYGNRHVSVITLYHPAVALYNGGMRATLLKDAEIITLTLNKE